MDFVIITDRLKELKNLRGDAAAAELLGISRTAFAERKRRNSIPFEELVKFCERENVSVDWLLTGEGPRRRGEAYPRGEPPNRYDVGTDRDLKEVVGILKESTQDIGYILSLLKTGQNAPLSEIIELLKENPQDIEYVLEILQSKKKMKDALKKLGM